ncbi:MAG TPA: hypothetical protein VMT60_02420, partial [Candidatus Bathyarchaeia archaeon]|nr:hypothetical protein [Candidatus Bathyarchaeia archaeon]
MAAPAFEKRLFTALFVGMIALHAVGLLSTRLYPFTDIPDHLAAATIIRDAGEPAGRLARYYLVDTFMKPNTFHVAFCALRIFPSVEVANRLFFALYVSLFPIAVLAAIRKLGGNSWFAFLSFLLVYGYSVSWGFAGFALAIPLVVLFCTCFVLDPRGISHLPRVIGAASFLAFLYFVHVLAAMFCLFVLLVDAVARRERPAEAARGLAFTALPLIVLVAAGWRAETRGSLGPGTLSFLAGYYLHSFVHTFPARCSLPILDNYHLFKGAAGYAIAGVFSFVIIAAAAFPRLAGRGDGSAAAFQRLLGRPDGPTAACPGFAPGPPDDAPARTAGSVTGRPAGALSILFAAVICCLLLPNEIPQQSVLYERFSVLALLALVIYGGSRAPGRIRASGAAVLVALSVLHYTVWANYLFDFNRENAGFDREFLRPAASGEKLAGLIYDYTYRGRPIYIHFPSYYIVWQGGAATSDVTDYRFGPIRRAASALELPRYLEWVGKRDNYDGRYRDMDCILMRGWPPGEAAAAQAGAGALIPPEAEPT